MDTNQMTMEQLLPALIRCLKENKRTEFQEMLDELQPYDMAECYLTLPVKHHQRFLLFSTPEQIAAMLQELVRKEQWKILHMLGVEQSSKIMDLMENDDLADMLSEMSNETIKGYLDSMEREESQTVKDLLTYEPDTAGGIMTNRFVWIRSYYTVREAVDKLKNFASYAENIYYLYVIDELKRLVGVVSYRDLLLADIDDKIDNIMYTRVIAVPVGMDQEEVASVIGKYDFIAVPVVDEEQRLVGIVTVDDVIDVMITEANEDYEKLAGTGKSIDFQTGAITATLRRLPWLLLLLLLGLFSGSLIANFEDILQQVVALTFFMPMIAGMTGNTGTQSLAIVVRGLATQDLNAKLVTRLLLREFGVSLMIGVTCGVMIALFSFIWQQDAILSLVVSVSLLFTLIIGTMAGTIIPLILYRFKIDPAVASGPLITTLNDLFSLLIYFGLATLFIQSLL
jgi:magnesium transporter